nr:alpha-1,4 glucan phosphorylase L isozyme, chloroplastic/amyloplastic-like [Ipomoea batatas]
MKEMIINFLIRFADNEDLQIEWRAAKRSNKVKVASFIKERIGYSVSPNAMFDIQVVFVPDYIVSVVELLIPASELSQHIRCVQYLSKWRQVEPAI